MKICLLLLVSIFANGSLNAQIDSTSAIPSPTRHASDFEKRIPVCLPPA
ncbi:hypothetical protein [Spirosoma horti]